MEGRWDSSSSSFRKCCCASIPLVLLLLMHLSVLIIFFHILVSHHVSLCVLYNIYCFKQWKLITSRDCFHCVCVYIYIYILVLLLFCFENLNKIDSKFHTCISMYRHFFSFQQNWWYINDFVHELYYFVHILTSINGLFHNVIHCYLNFFLYNILLWNILKIYWKSSLFLIFSIWLGVKLGEPIIL